jgi:hypothetical protein
MRLDPCGQERARALVAEAHVMLDAIRRLGAPGVTDPLADPATLARAVACGILDAPHLRNNPFACGQIVTRIDRRGANIAVEAVSGQPLVESERLAGLASL